MRSASAQSNFHNNNNDNNNNKKKKNENKKKKKKTKTTMTMKKKNGKHWKLKEAKNGFFSCPMSLWASRTLGKETTATQARGTHVLHANKGYRQL